MPTLLEEPTLVENEIRSQDNKKKTEASMEPPLYHGRPGVHPTPVEKRSPYWQPVDDQS